MHERENIICQGIKRIMLETENYIDLLYLTPCIYTKNMLAFQLKSKIEEIGRLSDMLCSQGSQQTIFATQLPQQNQIDLTINQLSKYDGKSGNPAYVAVNGVIYDVTDNAAWAAATHFGLTAGKDLTNEFASCHAGQTILNKLKAVGKLIQ